MLTSHGALSETPAAKNKQEWELLSKELGFACAQQKTIGRHIGRLLNSTIISGGIAVFGGLIGYYGLYLMAARLNDPDFSEYRPIKAHPVTIKRLLINLGYFGAFCIGAAAFNKLNRLVAQALEKKPGESLQAVTMFVNKWPEHKGSTPRALHGMFDALHADVAKNGKITSITAQQIQAIVESITACAVIAAATPA